MQIRTVAIMAVAACAIGMSTGCVKQEDLDNLEAKKNAEIEELKTSYTEQVDNRDKEIIELKTTLGEKDNLIARARAETSELRDDVSEAEGEIKTAKDEASRLQRQLDYAKSNVADMEAAVEAAESKCDKAIRSSADIERRYNMLRAALIALQQSNPSDYAIELKGVSPEEVDAADVMNELVGPAAVVQPAAAKTSGSASKSEAQALMDQLLKGM